MSLTDQVEIPMDDLVNELLSTIEEQRTEKKQWLDSNKLDYQSHIEYYKQKIENHKKNLENTTNEDEKTTYQDYIGEAEKALKRINEHLKKIQENKLKLEKIIEKRERIIELAGRVNTLNASYEIYTKLENFKKSYIDAQISLITPATLANKILDSAFNNIKQSLIGRMCTNESQWCDVLKDICTKTYGNETENAIRYLKSSKTKKLSFYEDPNTICSLPYEYILILYDIVLGWLLGYSVNLQDHKIATWTQKILEPALNKAFDKTYNLVT